MFAGLVAPNIFNNIYEYPILIAAALLAMPGMFVGGAGRFMREAAAPLMAAALVVAIRLLLDVRLPSGAQSIIDIALVLLAALMLFQARRPARFFGYVVLAFSITALWRAGVTPVETARSFFGVNRVVETADSKYRLLFHGTTIHGAQRVRDAAGMPVTDASHSAHLLLFRRADFRGGRSSAQCAWSPRSRRRGRPWHRQHGLPQARRRALDVF